jgi:hypothetical protein
MKTLQPITFFVEGKDDKRFVEKVIVPKCGIKYYRTIEYRQLRKEKVEAFYESEVQAGRICIMLCDKDGEPCFTQKKNRISSVYTCIPGNRILVAERQIDCWYFAGLDRKACQKLKLDIRVCSGIKAKEEWQEIIDSLEKDRVEFMLEAIENYAFEYARSKNSSLGYVINKLTDILSEVGLGASSEATRPI